MLDLSRTGVTNAGLPYLKKLRSLQTLVLTDTAVTDSGEAELAQLKGLKTLDLIGTHITDDGLVQLKAALPNTERRQIAMMSSSTPWGSSGDIYEQACQVGNGTIAGYPKHLFGIVGCDVPCD